MLFAKGCKVREADVKLAAEAESVARKADTVVMVLGLNSHIESEEGEGGDRTDLDLPAAQENLLHQIVVCGKPTILVLMNGSALAVNWTNENVPTILEAWYPGQRGGDAVADVLFGDYNPGGRLPVTFYKSAKDLPDFTNYDMKGRTYRYFSGKPLFSFGFGLSYTTFKYSKLKIVRYRDNNTTVSVSVKNTGKRTGDEVVELYVSRKKAPADAHLPIHALRAFQRVNLVSGESKNIKFKLAPFQFAFVGKDGVRAVEAANMRLALAAASNRRKVGR